MDMNNLFNIMTEKNAHTLISYNEHCAMLITVKLSYEKCK